MKAQLILHNLKCADCAQIVLKRVLEVEGVTSAAIDLEKSSITVDCQSYNALIGLSLLLTDMGYPIKK